MCEQNMILNVVHDSCEGMPSAHSWFSGASAKVTKGHCYWVLYTVGCFGCTFTGLTGSRQLVTLWKPPHHENGDSSSMAAQSAAKEACTAFAPLAYEIVATCF